MKTEKLELAHLAPYLPYGLKMQHNLSPTVHELTGIFYEQFKEGIYCVQFKNKKMLTPMSAVKPILRPLSDLVDTIIIAMLCKKAVASIWMNEDFDFIIKSYHSDGDSYGIVAESDGWRIGFSVSFEMEQDFNLTIGSLNQENPPYMRLNKLDLFNWLFENHFDVYSLIDKGLAVSYNDLK